MCLCGECSYSIYFSYSTIYIYSKIENALYFIAWQTHELKYSMYGVDFISSLHITRPKTKKELLDFIENIKGYAEIIRK